MKTKITHTSIREASARVATRAENPIEVKRLGEEYPWGSVSVRQLAPESKTFAINKAVHAAELVAAANQKEDTELAATYRKILATAGQEIEVYWTERFDGDARKVHWTELQIGGRVIAKIDGEKVPQRQVVQLFVELGLGGARIAGFSEPTTVADLLK